MANYKSYKKEVLSEISKAERSALSAIGLFVEAESKLRTPVKTGHLKRSITHKLNESEKSVSIGTNVSYAAYVELSTSKTKAQPYLMPAVTENKDKLKAIIKKYLKDMG